MVTLVAVPSNDSKGSVTQLVFFFGFTLRGINDNSPFTYTDFSYKSLRIAQFLRFDHFYERFKSCCVLLRAIYGSLLIITSYYDVFMVILHDLLRVVTDNYEHLTGI